MLRFCSTTGLHLQSVMIKFKSGLSLWDLGVGQEVRAEERG
jgi:hypothetical protein